MYLSVFPHRIHHFSIIFTEEAPLRQAITRGRGSPRAEGGEGLANIALDHVSLECQLHVPVNR